MKRIFEALKSKNKTEAVVSLEACIVLPLFIIFMMFLYGIMMMFYGQHIIMHSLIQSAESLSLDPYGTERLGSQEIETLTEAFDFKNLTELLYDTAFTGDNEYFSSDKRWYENNDDTMRRVVKERFLGFLSGGENSEDTEQRAENFLKRLNIQGGLEAFSFENTVIEEGVLKINVKYKQGFLFDFNGALSFEREHSFSIKMWDEAGE